MSRHRSHDILDQVVSGTLPVDQEATRIIPRGDDGAEASVQFSPQIDTLSDSSNETIAKHMSPKEEIGLGREAVKLAIQKAAFATSGTRHNKQAHNKEYEDELEDARDILRNLDTNQAAEIQRLLLAQPESTWMNQRLGIDKNDKGYALIDRLVEKKTSKDDKGKTIEDAEGNPVENYVVPDEVFQNFLEWHNHVIAERQHELDQQIDSIKEGYKDDIRRAVGEGWMPTEVLNKLGRLDKTLVYVDDGFGTNLRSWAGHASVVPQNGYAVITLSPSELEDPTGVLRHEFEHILDGQDFDKEDFSDHEGRPHESHGLYRLFGATIGGSKVNEAVTEHIRTSLENGEVDIIDPSHEKRKGATYIPERKLLNTLANAGVKKIDIRLFLAAYFEDNVNVKKRESNTQALYDQLKEAFPFANVTHEISGFTKATNIDDYIAGLHVRVLRYKDLSLEGKLKAA